MTRRIFTPDVTGPALLALTAFVLWTLVSQKAEREERRECRESGRQVVGTPEHWDCVAGAGGDR